MKSAVQNVCRRVTTALSIGAILAGSAGAQDTGLESVEGPVGPRLTAKVRGLLVEEMNAILIASSMMQAALVRGEWQKVAEQADGIRDSFILKKALTPEDRKSLRAAVGDAFITRDQAFHKLAGELAEAARAGDYTVQARLYGDMIVACTECHRRYATDRFPGYAASEGDNQ